MIFFCENKSIIGVLCLFEPNIHVPNVHFFGIYEILLFLFDIQRKHELLYHTICPIKEHTLFQILM